MIVLPLTPVCLERPALIWIAYCGYFEVVQKVGVFLKSITNVPVKRYRKNRNLAWLVVAGYFCRMFFEQCRGTVIGLYFALHVGILLKPG